MSGGHGRVQETLRHHRHRRPVSASAHDRKPALRSNSMNAATHIVWRAEQEETKAGDEGHWPGMLSSLAAIFAAVQHLSWEKNSFMQAGG